jgi:5-methylcytosine-specific restriction endonuclease McrA
MTPEWRAVILADPCVFCVLGEPGDGRNEMEHIRPRSYGGKNGWPNIAPACKAHNTMKANYSLLWMLWRLHEKREGRTFERPIRMRGRVVLETMTVYVNHAPWRRKRG